MFKAIFSRQIVAMERTWSYDASYMRALLNASPWTFFKFGLAARMVDRRDAPTEALAAAGIVGTLVEDCGPCTQISVDMALKAGIAPAVLQAILAGDTAAMGEDAALACAFAKASLARDIEAADPLRDRIVALWGRRGLTALALALTTARMYPTLKYALGHGRACSRIEVRGAATPGPRPEVLAA